MDKKEVETLFDVKGKVALVTGATGSLGSHICLGYGLAGVKVMMTGRNKEKLEKLYNEYTAKGIDCAYSAGDPTVEEDVIRIVKETVDKYGEINILVTAHGLNNPKSIIDHTLEDWQAIIDANVKGPWLYCKYVGEQLIKQGKGGKVILVSSARS